MGLGADDGSGRVPLPFFSSILLPPYLSRLFRPFSCPPSCSSPLSPSSLLLPVPDSPTPIISADTPSSVLVSSLSPLLLPALLLVPALSLVPPPPCPFPLPSLLPPSSPYTPISYSSHDPGNNLHVSARPRGRVSQDRTGAFFCFALEEDGTDCFL
ncbi:hypothetical protein C8R44DRAFT_892071 [Mycena epipterygia]|nr:hypothetical protein C8R44DRAFT_892071 [Mycena epipterygia]